MKNCIVRTWNNSFSNQTIDLKDKLKEGWTVKFITPFYRKGDTEFVEYILEKE